MQLQLCTTVEVQNIVSPAFIGMLSKLWGLKISQARASARSSQSTLIIRLVMPGLSTILPCHLIQPTTRWQLIDSSVPHFTHVSRAHCCRYDDTITKSIIERSKMYPSTQPGGVLAAAPPGVLCQVLYIIFICSLY